MKVLHTKFNSQDLPFKLTISFEKVYNYLKQYTTESEHPYYKSAIDLIAYLDQYPELVSGFSDFSLLDTHKEPIALMLESLFPEVLTHNEIKAASVPFSFTSFNFTKRFETIIENAGEDYEFKIRNFEHDQMYIMACAFILNFYYKKGINLKRSFFFDIPNKKTGAMHHYSAAINADFSEFIKAKNAPEITDNDVKLLLDNYDNIQIWKEKFPPNSYTYKGFAIINLFDVTQQESIASIRANLLNQGDNVLERLQNNLRKFFGINDLLLGYSTFERNSKNGITYKNKKSESLILGAQKSIKPNAFFCNQILKTVFKDHKSTAISDIVQYGKRTNKNKLYKNLKKKGINSILLTPIIAEGNTDIALLEIASPRAYELNSVVQQKLKDVMPIFEIAFKKATEELNNVIEATIQEHYTSIHPAVKWRFKDAAESYYFNLTNNSIKQEAVIEDIVFENVYPLYGQSDIKGSSLARNTAIKQDLIQQLKAAIKVLENASTEKQLPIYSELSFRIENYLNDVKKGLKAGDEVTILEFLKRDIYPVFNHIKTINNNLKSLVEDYVNILDKNLKVVYNKRKAYEDSVTILNNKLASFIDKKQDEAQAMFPHYFERYKTDGVEYNMYIGQSLSKEKTFDKLYLYNLRLWQLQLMCNMENVAYELAKTMPHKLQVASLILVHSNPLSIKFRMDEKQFDVDGAYNIRYEIIKKRIDKAHIKDTKDRLTVPGKIAIVYSQENDAKEYLKYIAFLQSKNLLGKVERLELEDLQSVSGLKALRVEVIYNEMFNEKSSLTIDELMTQIESS